MQIIVQSSSVVHAEEKVTIKEKYAQQLQINGNAGFAIVEVILLRFAEAKN